METIETRELTRKDIAIRFLYTLFFLIVFEIVKTILQITVLFQYIYLFITRTHNEPVRTSSNKVWIYAYRVMRYATLNENTRPFPFADLPEEIEEPEPEVLF